MHEWCQNKKQKKNAMFMSLSLTGTNGVNDNLNLNFSWWKFWRGWNKKYEDRGTHWVHYNLHIGGVLVKQRGIRRIRRARTHGDENLMKSGFIHYWCNSSPICFDKTLKVAARRQSIRTRDLNKLYWAAKDETEYCKCQNWIQLLVNLKVYKLSFIKRTYTYVCM